METEFKKKLYVVRARRELMIAGLVEQLDRIASEGKILKDYACEDWEINPRNSDLWLLINFWGDYEN